VEAAGLVEPEQFADLGDTRIERPPEPTGRMPLDVFETARRADHGAAHSQERYHPRNAAFNHKNTALFT